MKRSESPGLRARIPRSFACAAIIYTCFAASAHAKLGENAPEVIKRFGTNYVKENLSIGERYKFRSQNVTVDVTVVDGVSVAETYFSDHPLTEQGEPPNDIVRTVLKTNVPEARWLEINAAPLGADYALQSSDGIYIATLKYISPQPEKAIWTMTVAKASLLGQLQPAAPPNPSFPNPGITPRASPGVLDRAIQEAKRKDYEAAVKQLTQAIEKNPTDAESLAERGYNYSLLGDFDKAVSDYRAALKIRPNDHETEVRLQSATAMLALRTVPLPTSTATPITSLLPSPTAPLAGRREAGGTASNLIRLIALLGSATLCGIALARAFRRKTLRWIGSAVLATVFFGFVCLIFIQAVSDQIKRKREETFNRALGAASTSPLPTITSSPQTPTTPTPVPIVAEAIQRAVLLIAGMSSSNQPVASGTGFFISGDGQFMTCWHVVAPANIDHLRLIRSDGSECNLEGVLGFSAKNDAILLKAAVSNADFLRLRPSGAEKPVIGTRILVFGNPGQLRGVWSEGAVSGFVFGGKNLSRDSLRFDAPVAPGSSGSPVVDINKGDVVGIASGAGWMLGNFAVPFYQAAELVDSAHTATPVPIAQFKTNLEKEKPAIKQQVYDKELAGDFLEASRLCEEYSSQYPGDVWGTWEHAQISFALGDYNAANFYTAWLQPAKDPGDDVLGAIQFETGDLLFWAPAQRESLKKIAGLLRSDYGVEICRVQMPKEAGLNVREKPDAKSGFLYQFDSDEHVFAKLDRVRNAGGREAVTWRKVLLLPSRDRVHGGEGWVNERYLVPLDLSENNVDALRKAAARGDALAEVNLGWLYHEGKGLPKDYNKAAELYRKAADQGNAVGQAYLASQYAEGKGVPKNYDKALELFHKAIDQGRSQRLQRFRMVPCNLSGSPAAECQ